jgi:DnaK suppressor protein
MGGCDPPRAVNGRPGLDVFSRMKKATSRKPSRTDSLRALLDERRRELTGGMHGLMRSVRSRDRNDHDDADAQDGAHVDVQEDVDLAMIQMKAETLRRIDAALRRLDEGSYGNCAECGEPIAHERLKALPFAVRCRDCEDSREQASRGARQQPGRPRHAALDLVE